MNDNKKRIIGLIRADIITMNGGKNNMKTILILLFLFFGGFGFMFTPLIGLYCPLIMGLCFVPMIFRNELKYHSENMYSILPIKRRDLVDSRFALSIGLYTVLFILFYFLMLLSLIIKPYYFFMGEMGEMIDIIAMIAKVSEGKFTEFGLFNLLYFSAYSLGLIAVTSSLRKYFKDNQSMNWTVSIGQGKKAGKKELVYAVFALIFIALIVLMITGIIPMGGVISLIQTFAMQLAEAANGILLSLMVLSIAVFWAVYKYVCTVLEYDDKEL